MAEGESGSAERTIPLITPRVLAGLGVIALAQGVLTAACVLPTFSLFSIPVLPQALTGMTLALTLLLVPAWSDDPRAALESRAQHFGRCLFISIWLAAALAFFLLIATRVTPTEGGRILRAALILGATAWIAQALARSWSNAYFGIVLFWAVIIPMSAFVVAEVFISTPSGSMGWSRAKGPGVNGFRTSVEWLLRFSPGTALIGTLNGKLPGEAPCGWREAGAFAAACVLCGGLLQWRSAPAGQPTTADKASAPA